MRYDLALIGAGLHNSLICLALRRRQPQLRLLLLEAGPQALGNQLWSCHGGELGGPLPDWLLPALSARWEGCEVRFPSFRRSLAGGYLSLRAASLRQQLLASLAPQAELVCNARVESLQGDRIELHDGRHFQADRVVDGRGWSPARGGGLGFQNFFGQEVRCRAPHGLTRPLLMDATVPQLGGYRFVYVLPLEPDLLLVEDTYFADDADLDPDVIRQRLRAYIAAQGWSIAAVEREEQGSLPMPWERLPEPLQDGRLCSGFRGGWFHPATGYSLGLGVRLATAIAADPSLLDDPGALRRLQRPYRDAARFALLLNRLQFRWYPPQRRLPIYERFFRLPEDLIQRFFALRSSRRDCARIVCGRPPRGLSLRRGLVVAAREGLGTST